MKITSEFISEFRKNLKKICAMYDRVWVTRRRKFDTELMFWAIASQVLDRGASNYRLLYDHLMTLKVESVVQFSASSYSKARRKMPFEVFADLAQWVYRFTEIPQNQKWLGLNVFAIDSTVITLPKELEREGFESFHCDDSESPQAMATVLFDLQKGMVYDSIFTQHNDERGNAKVLLKSLPDNSLLICDRGFTGFDFLYDLESENVQVIARMPEAGSPTELQEFIDSDSDDEIISMTLSKPTERKMLRRGYIPRPVTVRAIKYFIGKSRFIAITTLLDEGISKNVIASMYWCRWDIEECFKLKKEKLKFENFRAKHLQGILQEFWAMQFIVNFTKALIIFKSGTKSKEENRREISPFGVCKVLKIRFFNLVNLTCDQILEEVGKIERAFEMITHKFRSGRRYPRIFFSRTPYTKGVSR